jgi:hypothetical protein
MAAVIPFSDEQARALVNLRQRYEVWIEAQRSLFKMPYDLRRKTIGGKDYLYQIFDRSGNGTSLGHWDIEKQRRFEAYRADKAALKQRREGARAALDESSRQTRALRLPLLSSAAGPILREADRRGLLGNQLIVVGTNCMAAYAQEAASTILGAPDETEDFDLAWAAEELGSEAELWNLLKAVDPTFAINSERDFQARNASAYEVELLVAPSRAGTMAPIDRPRPIPLPEQEWLLLGSRVDQIVPCRDGSPARVVAPDPRWFALHKLWMAKQAKRNPLKRPKDRKQGMALLNAIDEAMPQFPLDETFATGLPAELQPFWQFWLGQRPSPSLKAW